MSNTALIELMVQTNFVSLSAARSIAGSYEHRQMAKNEYLLKAGQVPDTYLFLARGYLRAFAQDTDGNDVTTNFYVPGDMVFEVASFFNGKRSRENIQALTDAEGWFITLSKLNEFFHTLPEFREFGRAMLVRGFSQLKNRMLSMITETAEERYLQLVSTQPELFQHASLKHIASYLGITDTSLSRIRASLAKK
jgi:CRP-like cAMP-binding protein